MTQEFNSAKTSLNQIPRLHKEIVKRELIPDGSCNFDNGSGKYLTATEFLNKNGIVNILYDPFNLSIEHNSDSEQLALLRLFNSSTTSNVLNVIKEDDVRNIVIARSGYVLKEDGVAFFTVYEGSKDGIPKETTKGYQLNKKLKDYVGMVSVFFNQVIIKNNIIIAKRPNQERILQYKNVLF